MADPKATLTFKLDTPPNQRWSGALPIEVRDEKLVLKARGVQRRHPGSPARTLFRHRDAARTGNSRRSMRPSSWVPVRPGNSISGVGPLLSSETRNNQHPFELVVGDFAPGHPVFLPAVVRGHSRQLAGRENFPTPGSGTDSGVSRRPENMDIPFHPAKRSGSEIESRKNTIISLSRSMKAVRPPSSGHWTPERQAEAQVRSA